MDFKRIFLPARLTVTPEELAQTNRVSQKFALALSPAQADVLARRQAEALRDTGRIEFGGLTDAESDAALSAGAELLCAILDIQNRQTVRYLDGLALGLRPRLRAALTGGTLESVFLAL